MSTLLRIWLPLFIVLLVGIGCSWRQRGLVNGQPGTAQVAQDNPLFVPATDRDVLWDQIVDSVDDYFKIQREQRVRLVGDVPLEGRIDTFPTDGSTLLEPWRKDSTHGYEKLHATLQSLRRVATVRVQPVQGGYLIEVVVQKYLEDLERPEHATTGHTPLTEQQSLRGGFEGDLGAPIMLGWIPIGRDATLEQRIVDEIRGRTTGG
jgi:hypothetical protein